MFSLENLPRALILCHEPINRIGGGGVTMGNLFRGWPQDRLAQVWAHHRFEIDTDICPNNLRLSAHTMPGSGWVPGTVRQQRELVRRLRPILRPGVRFDYERVRLWVSEFAPEVIYSQATPQPMYTWWLPRWLSRDLKVPLVHHIMDDWPAALEAEWAPPFRQVLTPVLRRQLNALFAAAEVNLAICQQMADAFAARYGTTFIPFHNAVDLTDWTTPKQDYGISDDTFRVVYLGALGVEMQLLSLQSFARVVSSLAERGVPISLTVYTGGIYLEYFRQYLGDLTAVHHGGTVARQDLCSRLAAADLLVLPVNFDLRGQISGRYSMPTKVPEYMASGTPVLVYAPGHVPAAQYARESGWGYLVDHEDPGLLENAVTELMNSRALRARLGLRGRELAILNHDAQKVRTRFRNTLLDAANARQPT